MAGNDFFDRAWFDVVKFNFREMSPGFLGIHVWKAPYRCILLTLPSSEFQNPQESVWLKIHQLSLIHWAKQKEIILEACPECGAFLHNTRRYWKGKPFCQGCGTHLEE